MRNETVHFQLLPVFATFSCYSGVKGRVVTVLIILFPLKCRKLLLLMTEVKELLHFWTFMSSNGSSETTTTLKTKRIAALQIIVR
jgi:hypothetical protein